MLPIPPAVSTIDGNDSVHFRVSFIWNKLPNIVKSNKSISEFKNIIKKIEILTVFVRYVEGSTF